jgi:hypothetical protein
MSFTEWGYVEITSQRNVTQTDGGAGNRDTIFTVSLPAGYDGSPIDIHIATPWRAHSASGPNYYLGLKVDGVGYCRFSDGRTNTVSQQELGFTNRIRVPGLAAGAHTFVVTCYVDSGTASFGAADGRTLTGNDGPFFCWVTSGGAIELVAPSLLTAQTNSTSTSSAAPDTILTGNAFTLAAQTEVLVQLSGDWIAGSTTGQTASLWLYDNGSKIARLGAFRPNISNAFHFLGTLSIPVTLAAGSHQLSLRCSASGAMTTTFGAANGGNNVSADTPLMLRALSRSGGVTGTLVEAEVVYVRDSNASNISITGNTEATANVAVETGNITVTDAAQPYLIEMDMSAWGSDYTTAVNKAVRHELYTYDGVTLTSLGCTGAERNYDNTSHSRNGSIHKWRRTLPTGTYSLQWRWWIDSPQTGLLGRNTIGTNDFNDQGPTIRVAKLVGPFHPDQFSLTPLTGAH